MMENNTHQLSFNVQMHTYITVNDSVVHKSPRIRTSEYWRKGRKSGIDIVAAAGCTMSSFLFKPPRSFVREDDP